VIRDPAAQRARHGLVAELREVPVGVERTRLAALGHGLRERHDEVEVGDAPRRQLVEEAQLFIEAAHACWERVADRQASDSSLAQGAPSPTGG